MPGHPSRVVSSLYVLLVLGALDACARVKQPGSSGGGGSGGSVLGFAGSGGPGTGGGFHTGAGGAAGVAVTLDPTPGDCGPGGTCVDGYVCTTANKCGKAGASCAAASDCQGDTYCCAADCRKDAKPDAVCIPGNVPPGAACKGAAVVGVFSPHVQCEWTDDTSSFVASSPLVGDLPNDPNSAEIVFVSFGGTSGADTGATVGVLRIIDGNDCRLLETISDPPIRANTTPALADLDGDGIIEIVALKADGKPVAFKWNGTHYAQWWSAATGPNALTAQMWSGISIHNLDDDAAPEILVGTNSSGFIYTFNGLTGAEVSAPVPVGTSFNGMTPVVGDLDGDGVPELLTNWQSGVFMSKWMGPGMGWAPLQAGRAGQQIANYQVASQFGLADFGTPMAGGGFDPKTLDGIPEIVTTEAEVAGQVSVLTLTGQVVMNVLTMKDPGSAAISEGGGSPVIGDFDNDGFPEIGVAGGSRFRVFDLGCAAGGAGCEAPFVRWSKPSQDASSRQTGASVFDFDGDGRAEVVYADECFLRIYDGTTGDVLYSTPRTSGTWYENPVVADVDHDDHVEIVVNSAFSVPCPFNGVPGTPYVDPIHPGVRCLTTDDCVLGTQCQSGFCRCTGNAQCDVGLTCQPPLDASSGKVCRSTHPNVDPKVTPVKGGIKVVNDRLDRWASSLPIWNQHAYSITNVRANGAIPKMSEWKPNWTVTGKGYNSFRQNAQGTAGVDDLPDVTGKLDTGSICRVTGKSITLTARVCNRGSRAVGSKLPATFYDQSGKILCVSYTTEPVQGNNDCKPVSCSLDASTLQGTVRLVVNDDGMGGRTTVECREDNNSDELTVKLSDCIIP
ncbi:MAG TPA: VCBS repeat-containing protein [Polyangia bacterium]|jgi:hypothetical protein